MSNIIDFIKKLKAPILWTIGYVCILWLIYIFLFNFDIFNTHNWIRVSRTHLRGLGGLTFCMLTFSAIPLYISSTTLVYRNQKLLFTIPMPKFISALFTKSKPEPEPEKTEEKNESENTQPTNEEIDKFPAEMRGAFIHARTHPNRITAPICSACSTNPNIYPNGNDTPTEPNNMDADLPLPPDFDIADNNFNPTTTPSAPVFQDINLYSDQDTNNTPDNNPTTPVTEYLTKNNRQFTILPNDIILTDNQAIIVHTDSDFWIMDDPVWFASGKTRNSPIDALCDTAEQNKVTPVFYIGATNIMDFDAKCESWKSRGIHIITTLTDL